MVSRDKLDEQLQEFDFDSLAGKQPDAQRPGNCCTLGDVMIGAKDRARNNFPICLASGRRIAALPLPCRARTRLQASTVSQADRMRSFAGRQHVV